VFNPGRHRRLAEPSAESVQHISLPKRDFGIRKVQPGTGSASKSLVPIYRDGATFSFKRKGGIQTLMSTKTVLAISNVLNTQKAE
jgi:hypothetical protein